MIVMEQRERHHQDRLNKALERLPSQAAAYADSFHVERQSNLIEELYGDGEAAYQGFVEDERVRHPEAIVLSPDTYYWDVTVRAARAGISSAKAHPELDDDDYSSAVRSVENTHVLPADNRQIKTCLSVVALTATELQHVVGRYFQLGAEDWLLERDSEDWQRTRDAELARGEK